MQAHDLNMLTMSKHEHDCIQFNACERCDINPQHVLLWGDIMDLSIHDNSDKVRLYIEKCFALGLFYFNF